MKNCIITKNAGEQLRVLLDEERVALVHKPFGEMKKVVILTWDEALLLATLIMEHQPATK